MSIKVKSNTTKVQNKYIYIYIYIALFNYITLDKRRTFEVENAFNEVD